MRVVIQRVTSSSVTINSSETRSIGPGLTILLGVTESDTNEDINWLVRKIAQLRIFADENGVMNISVADIKGSILVISQFTLYASTKKGNRPSYIRSAAPDIAEPLYQRFIERLQEETGLEIKTGEFGADMLVSIQNDGPVTIIIDTHNKE